jgi:predicted ABC-type ATPase
MMPKPELIIVGGANGSGKTTFALKYAAWRGCPYLGADAIATEFSPGSPELAAVEAGKEFIRRLATAVNEETSVVIESTLSGRSLRHTIVDARSAGFSVSIVYIFLDSADSCVKRVAERVQKGGHAVPESDIRRRFSRSLANFWRLYRSLADNWTLLYNSAEQLVDVASGSPNEAWVREGDLYSLFQGLVSIAGNG